jgi:hypothetical protein
MTIIFPATTSQININITSLSGILLGVNEASCNLVAGQSGSYNVIPYEDSPGQPLIFFISGCTVTGNTISFTDSNGKAWSQQITQLTGLIKRSQSFTHGAIIPINGELIPDNPPDSGLPLEGFYNPYSVNAGVDITETWADNTTTILAVNFTNCKLLISGTISVSIT